ncbi:DUF5724 domain-containing protein [Jiangella endophytica]|uniref:DUF5724 domain-containing protein n=1 Tax=Jiangella endophytica TaxID=1623398 RepID=UPI000E34D9B6|nr:DUF5724 domain-containing protein [Jiangella endophytica]
MALSREAAQEQLERFHGGRRGPRQLVRRAFAGEVSRDLVTWLDDRRSHDPLSLAARLDDLAEPDLARTFAPIAPTLATPLAHWWVRARRMPYQRHWLRRGFRSSRPADTRPARMDHLGSLLRLGHEWPQDVTWFAAWSIHLRQRVPTLTSHLGGLFAAEIARGRTEVADVLAACAFGRNPVGGVTTEGIQGLLGSDRPADWETATALLRGAGRQEGARSAVLEAADLAHPEAYRRILDAVVDENLLRFAGTVRAVGVWFGEALDVRTGGRAGPMLTELSSRLGGAPAPPQTPDQVFLTLWAAARTDAHTAVAQAGPYLADPEPAVRQAAARVLAELGLPESRAALVPLLTEPDAAVYATAVSAWPTNVLEGEPVAALGRAAAAALLERVRTLGRAHKVETGRIGSRPVEIGSARAADVLLANLLTAAPPEAFRAASANGRRRAADLLAGDRSANRAALFAFLTDASSSVRARAFEALRDLPLRSETEARALEDALRRKAADLRTIALTLLRHQPRSGLLASVERLGAGTAEQRRAAAELAASAGVAVPAASVPAPVAEAGDAIPVALRYRPADRTPAVRPDRLPSGHFDRFHSGCRQLVTSLRAWLGEHADTEVRTLQGVQLLRNVRWLGSATPSGAPPLPEIVGPWWERVGPALTDGGVELLLVQLGTTSGDVRWAGPAQARIAGRLPARHRDDALLWQLVHDLGRSMFRPSWTDPLLDALAELCHDLPTGELVGPPEVVARRGRRLTVDQWGHVRERDARSGLHEALGAVPLRTLTDEQAGRLWRLARFVDEPEGTIDVFDGPRVMVRPPRTFAGRADAPESVLDQPTRWRPAPALLARAVTAGAATRADLLDALVDGDETGAWRLGGHYVRRDAVAELSARRPPERAAAPVVRDVVEEVRAAAIAGELRRGDLAGPLSHVAQRLRSATGAASLAGVLAALGKRPLTRGYVWTDSRESVLSHLARIHLPGEDDTVSDLRAALDVAGIAPKRVVEYGVYAPQWAGLIEQYLDWPGFESAVWWVHAHTKDDSWSVDRQIRDEWASAVSQRTPLDSVDLVRGSADVGWFRETLGELGEERFTLVLKAAKYASSSGGHKRAELFARALLGHLAESELLERIEGKRHQDSVRALGLLPLSGPDDPAVVSRYGLLRGFVGSDRTSGSQRRASETTAVTVALENLARSAGYRDPQRLTWAMEAGDHVADDERPAARRKRIGRMRRSLEQACADGEAFEPAELDDLLRHPVLATLLRDLVLVTEEGVLGFAGPDAWTLVGSDGEPRPADGSRLRVAHPVDLLESGEWAELQHAAFTGRRQQPFRQLFRELYLPTAHEYADGPFSRRYAGHQVQARRAAGLFTSRGWVADFGTGFSRTFHAEKLTAWCSVLDGFGTAAEVEDTTIEDVTFVRPGRWEPVSPDDVPHRVFSETMRDLDLVVSVAHAGGADPESTESSVQMRARLVEETAALLGLDNVDLIGRHARIRGALGSYSVHLGSGQVHRTPGNAVCIIPVGAQHRGRIFLPFADDDPRTAEVISKVVLLARDERIQDPSILEQLL